MSLGDVSLKADDVSRCFRRLWAVRRFSAEFRAGTASLIVGHNGSGKSTLLQLLAGIMRPSEGRIDVFGADVRSPNGLQTMRRRMAFLGHQPGVYGELSGLENLRFFSRLHGHDTADKELERTLDGFELGRAARRPVQTYSRGMIQRLALARVSVQGADLWLLDEPMTGLDDAGRELFVKLLDGARQDGKTIVAVTHDPATLEAVADQKLVLKNGRLWGGDA